MSPNIRFPTSKASDQPAHMCSLVRAFAIRLNILGVLELLTEDHLEFLSFKGTAQAFVSPLLSKCQIVGNHMSRLY